MGEKYLNGNVKFKCQCGNMVLFEIQNGERKVKICGAEALTEDTSLKLIGIPRTGQCNLVLDPTTGLPSQCIATSVSSKWSAEGTVKICGKTALKSSCSIKCSRNGTIVPFRPTTIAINIDDAAVVKRVVSGYSKRCEKNTKSVTEKLYEDENIESMVADDADGVLEAVREQKYALCDYKNCKKVDSCQYIRAMHVPKETDESKNAVELRLNMGKDRFDLYAGECADIATSLYGAYLYRIAHHHIIPVNQCFKMFPEIVKLANYYGYNINKAENGICLPTMNEGYDKQPFEIRKEIAFSAMQNLGKQWHKGGHKYSCGISAEIDSILPRPFLHYKDAVDKELIGFRIRLTDELKCRADNYEQQAAEFIRTMDHICERIVKRLRRFEDNPRKSYPCYVSKLAFYFAFNDELKEYEDELFKKEG